MTPIDKLKAVLCDPEGKCCIHGSDEDRRIVDEAITALQSIIDQDALYKLAEDAVTIGLSYNDWPKIGCVNHDCDKCKAVQDPVYWNVVDPAGNIVASETDAIRGWARIAGSYKPTVEGLLGFHDQGWRVLPKVTPPAAQKPWVGLTTEEIYACDETSGLPQHEITNADLQAFAYAIEAKLKEKNT